MASAVRSEPEPAPAPSDAELAASLRDPGFSRGGSRYALLRAVILRALGSIYAVAFTILVLQLRPLIGAQGLLPASDFLNAVAEAAGSRWLGFVRLPTLFWLGSSDAALVTLAALGLCLALVVLAGFGNAPILFALWALYLSFVHVGQIFYGYGWESLLCEAGFLAIFLAPAWDPRAIPARSAPPLLVIVLLRWLTFRLMFGAGSIKIRGDECWTSLTCLVYHYETQPNPGPLSPLFHRLPLVLHQAGVLVNHLAELILPFGVFGPRRLRCAAGAGIIAFQLILILSGNLSFLNWLTIAVALACFDDGVVERLFSPRSRRAAAELERQEPALARKVVLGALGVVIAFLSINPVVNLLSPRQRMNASFDRWLLVNTYGAFGSVGRERREVVLEGTNDPAPGPGTSWRAFELPCKPGDPARRPCWITPYHYRLDWQMWFVQFGGYENQPWLVRLVDKLLRGDRLILSLFVNDPFPERPPRFVRAAFYRYRFAPRGSPDVWSREYLGDVIGPVTSDDPRLRAFLARYGWDRR